MTASSLEVLFDVLAGASIAGAVAALVAWAIGGALVRLPAAARCTLWWLVSLKLLAGLIAIEPVALPVLPRAMAANWAISAPLTPTSAAPTVSEDPAAATVNWRAALTVLWLGGLAVVSMLTVGQWRRLSSLRARARPAPAALTSLVRELSERAGLSTAPDVRFSDEIDAPMVTGLTRPVVILPSRRWPSLSGAQQSMALCHELMHVRRRDLWLGLVPSLAERLFFFHPLAHLAAREYLVAREAACDAAVLRTLDAEPSDYARLLVTLGVQPLAGGIVASGAAQSFSDFKRRIRMLDHGSPTLSVRVAGWTLALAALAALVPLTLVARPSEPPVAGRGQHAISRQNAPGSGLDYTLVLGEKDGTIVSGQVGELRLKAARGGHDRVLWFRRNGKAYEVRDSAAIDEAAAIVAPMSDIGRRQGEIGARQGAIGAQQGMIGARQGEVGARQGIIGARQGTLGARQGAHGTREAQELSASEKQQVEREHAEIDREMQALNAKMAELDRQMREVAASMPDLSGEMDELSKQMEVLSRKMTEASAKADAEMQVLVEKLIKLGTAKPIN